MTTRTDSIRDKAVRLIRAATGNDYGDGLIVTDIAIGYAEPGYGSDDAVIVFGNWNPKRFPRGDDTPLTKAEALAPRLADALDRIGAEVQWLDEWATCGECYRAMRTQPDSYSWTMYGAITEDGFVCADCMNAYPDDFLAEYINNADRAVTWCDSARLTGLGWAQWEPGNEQIYAAGWYEGQTDDPHAILASVLALHPDAELVFLIDGVGQFDVHFTAWVRGLNHH